MPAEYRLEIAEDQIRATRLKDEATVTLAPDWVEPDEVEGQWERAIEAIVFDGLELITHENGRFTMPYPEAVMSLIRPREEYDTIAADRQHAEALLAYFSREEILEFSGDTLVLFSDSDNDLGQMVLNVSILLDAVCEELNECIQEIKSAEEQLEARLPEIKGPEHETDGLEPERIESMLESVSKSVERVESLRIALSQRRNEARTAAMLRNKVPTNVFTPLTQNWSGIRMLSMRPSSDDPKRLIWFTESWLDLDLGPQLAGVISIEDEVEPTDPGKLADLVEELTEDVSSVAADVSESGEGDESLLEMGPSDFESQGDDSQSGRSMGEPEPGAEVDESLLNLTPIVKQDQPSSKIKVGRKKVGPGTEMVEIMHKGARAHFYVDPVEDSVVDKIGNKVKMHRNVVSLFDGIDRRSDFLVRTDVNKHDITECESVTIATADFDGDELTNLLRDREYLLHPIEEVIAIDDDPRTFEIEEMVPEDESTLRVTSETEIEML